MKSGINRERRGLLKSGSKLIAAAALAALLTVGGSASAFAAGPAKAAHKKKVEMHTYVIERNIPGAGSFSKAKLKEISQKSNGVLKDMGPDIQWVDSYVTGDKVYCIYRAKNEDLIREHAKRGGFPADRISEVDTMISPATGK
jgi:Protein of unknown function (DUF4242)